MSNKTEGLEHSGECETQKKLNMNQDRELKDSEEGETHKTLDTNQSTSAHQQGKKKRRYLIKGMTRDDYNDWMASILKHKKNLQPKAKRKKSKTNLRRSGRTPGKHDGI